MGHRTSTNVSGANQEYQDVRFREGSQTKQKTNEAKGPDNQN